MPTPFVTFVLRKSEKEARTDRLILLRVTIGQRRSECSTRLWVSPDSWDNTNHRVLGEGSAVEEQNNLLQSLHARALLLHEALSAGSQPVTAAAITNAIRQGVPVGRIEAPRGPLYESVRIEQPLQLQQAPAQLSNSDTLARRSNTVAFQHNHLIRTPLRMGEVEARIFVEALRGINHGQHGDTALPPIDIPVSAILGKNEGAEAYARIRTACKALFEKDLNLLQANSRRPNDFHKTHIVSDLELSTGTGRIRGNWAPKMKPYLVQLSEAGNFTSANIAILLTMTPNAQRLYWILKSYAGIGTKDAVIYEESLDEVKRLLLEDANLYPVFAEFKRRVLDPIKEEFTSADVAFPVSWKPLKTGKKVTSIEFTIPREERGNRKALVAAAAPVAGALGLAPDRFAEWLAGQHPNLQKAYAGLISTSNRNSQGANHLSPAVARKIVEYVAGRPELEATLYSARHQITITTEPVKDKAGYSYTQLVKALGREFR